MPRSLRVNSTYKAELNDPVAINSTHNSPSLLETNNPARSTWPGGTILRDVLQPKPRYMHRERDYWWASTYPKPGNPILLLIGLVELTVWGNNPPKGPIVHQIILWRFRRNFTIGGFD
jgi:hypothetical protein